MTVTGKDAPDPNGAWNIMTVWLERKTSQAMPLIMTDGRVRPPNDAPTRVNIARLVGGPVTLTLGANDAKTGGEYVKNRLVDGCFDTVTKTCTVPSPGGTKNTTVVLFQDTMDAPGKTVRGPKLRIPVAFVPKDAPVRVTNTPPLV